MSAAPRTSPQVDEDIERSAQPKLVRAALERLSEQVPALPARLDEEPAFRAALLAVISTSRSLTRFLESAPDCLDVLGALDAVEPAPATGVEDLVRWKHCELLRITARDVTGIDDLEATGRALADLADEVLAAAVAIGDRQLAERHLRRRDAAEMASPGDLAVIGMGKLGGRELNYASDVDVLFVGDGPMSLLERRARAALAVARHCFRVDTNLRPQGRDGPLVRSLDSFEAYWGRWAEPWEFQALLKVRPVAGDAVLGARFAETAGRWLWSHPTDVEVLRSLRAMKRRAEQEVARRGLADREIKRGPGGIRDIEFTVQLLQLVHGHLDPALRVRATLTALAEMTVAGYIDPRDADQLARAYRFLRVVEHRLQLEDEHQVHTVPARPDALDRLARVLGYRGRPGASATEQFCNQLVQHQAAVRSIHERVYFRPLLEAFVDTEPHLATLSPEAAAARLTAFGFTDATRTQVAVRELTRGLSRSSRLMQQMLPLLLDWLSESPNPDQGLLMLRNLLTGQQRRTQLVAAFRESPEVARRLCTIAGTSRLLADIIGHHPDLVARLPHTERLAIRPVDELALGACEAISWRESPSARQAGLRRWKDRHLLGIAARDVFGDATVETVGSDLTALAEACLDAALAALDPQVPFCVLALGRFGAAELSYASDLDVVFVFDGGAGTAEEALRVSSGLLRFVGGATPAEQLYAMDVGLRPEGKQGPLARSLDGFRHYWDRYALVWERQAWMRARPVAGDLALGGRLLDDLAPRIWGNGLSADDVREIRRMKARVERERIPFGEDPQFHLKLGRGSLSDVEWTAQLLQLTHGIRSPGTLQALRLLVDADVLDVADADILVTSFRFCERTRNRWFLVNSKPGNSLPTAPDQLLWLARSLDLTPTELREQYRRVTRRARRVVERVFYGQER